MSDENTTNFVHQQHDARVIIILQYIMSCCQNSLAAQSGDARPPHFFQKSHTSHPRATPRIFYASTVELLKLNPPPATMSRIPPCARPPRQARPRHLCRASPRTTNLISIQLQLPDTITRQNTHRTFAPPNFAPPNFAPSRRPNRPEPKPKHATQAARFETRPSHLLRPIKSTPGASGARNASPRTPYSLRPPRPARAPPAPCTLPRHGRHAVHLAVRAARTLCARRARCGRCSAGEGHG